MTMTSGMPKEERELRNVSDPIPASLRTETGGRRRYFVLDRSGERRSLDVVNDSGIMEHYLKMGWREVSYHEYLEYGKRHAGVTYLNNVYLSDKTHTRLRDWLKAKRDLKIAGWDTMSMQQLAATIIELWVRDTLGHDNYGK